MATDQTEMLSRPATELAALVREGTVTSRELVETSLGRIEETQPQLNAYTSVHTDLALADADAIGPGDERPFAGVPIAIKDLSAPIAGRRQTQGSELFGEWVPDYDSYVVRRIREAGFVIVGQTSAPEFGILPVTEPRRFGPTRNPWDTSRTPGGSSGGSAAAVSAGTVPLAHASDGAGSIRIPAACCGLVGLKPSRGRISRGPDTGDSALVTDGVVTRTVADTAAMLDLLAGYELGDATWAPPPAEPFVMQATREPGRLRIGMFTTPPLEAPIDPVSGGAVSDAAALLVELGHEVEKVEPPWAGAELLPTFTALWAPMVAVGVTFGGMLAGREPRPEDVEPLTWELYRTASELNSIAYSGAVIELQAYSRSLTAFAADYDVLLMPALAQRPVEIGAINAMGVDPLAEFAKAAAFTPFTAVANLMGAPAISVPLFHGDDGLPLAVQFLGRALGEGTLLSLAAQLEAARPWAERRPGA